jgi:hypothetical protein
MMHKPKDGTPPPFATGCPPDMRTAVVSTTCLLLSSSEGTFVQPLNSLKEIEDTCAGVRLMLEQVMQVCVRACVCVRLCVCACMEGVKSCMDLDGGGGGTHVC